MGADTARFWRRGQAGLVISVRLTPRSSRDGVDGVAALNGQAHLIVRVKAVPEKGKANAALEKLLAGVIGVPASGVRVAGGARSRLKSVSVAGDAQTLERKLRSALASGGKQEKQ